MELGQCSIQLCGSDRGWNLITMNLLFSKAYVRRDFEHDETEANLICEPARWGHTLNVVVGGLLYIFGGVVADGSITNRVIIFDTNAQKWKQPLIRGVPPEARIMHTANLIEENIFVYGGGNLNMELFNDLHLLNTSTNTWTSPIVTGEVPPARRGHGAAAIKKQLFVHGGCGQLANWSSVLLYNDLYILDTETFVWRRAITSGAIPSQREGHTCSAWGNKLVVVGGRDSMRNYLCDVHILDTDTLVWTRLNIWGAIMPARAFHTTVAFGNNLFVFGGTLGGRTLYDDFYKIDLESGASAKLAGSGEEPSARRFLAGDILCSQPACVLVFFGGCDGMRKSTEDVHYFHTDLDSGAEETTGLQIENHGRRALEDESPRKKKAKLHDQGVN